jgi:hypothetical protein
MRWRVRALCERLCHRVIPESRSDIRDPVKDARPPQGGLSLSAHALARLCQNVIPAQAGLRRQDAEAKVGAADGPHGERRGWREYIQ